MEIVIDVIIPTYNRENLVIRAIESVLNQTYKHFNLFIVDDGSTDKTFEKIKPYLSHNVFYLKKSNGGVSSARNFGILNSHSPWVAFLDSDDIWHTDKLQVQIEQIKSNPKLSFFHANEIWMRNEKRVNLPAKFSKSAERLMERSLEMCLISPSTVIIKRTLLNEFDGFDESILLCEDYDLWNKILNKYDIGFSPKELITKFAGHGDQLSMIDPLMDMWRIRSLVKFLETQNLTDEKRELVLSMLKQKVPVIKRGLIKFNKIDDLKEIETLEMKTKI